MMGLFGKTKDPKEQVRELQRKMRGEMRSLDRQIHGIQREEQKVVKQIKEAAKKGDKDVCLVLAKSMLQSRKAVSKIYASKAQINSVIMAMQEQLAAMRMAGSIQQSTVVMKNMQDLVKIMKTMRDMSQEMIKLGIMDEMIEETMSSLDGPNIEEEAQEEVEKILYEVTDGELGKLPRAVTSEIGTEDERNKAFEDVRARLAELRD